jgi:hypothetical protein
MMILLMLVGMLQQESAPPVEKEIPVLVKLLGSEDPKIRARAEQRLEMIGDPALPFLQKGAKEGDPKVQARCRDLLKKLEFKPGARKQVDWSSSPELVKDGEERKKYEGLLTTGKTEEILKEDHRWLLDVIDGLLSDSQPVADGSMRLLHEIIRRRGIEVGDASELASKQRIPYAHVPAARAGEYEFWAHWWFNKSSREAVASWKASATPEDCKGLLEKLRTAEPATLDDPKSAEGEALAILRGAGPAVWPTLIALIGHDDLALSRAAVLALKKLTKRDSEIPDENSKASIRKAWDAWLKERR